MIILSNKLPNLFGQFYCDFRPLFFRLCPEGSPIVVGRVRPVEGVDDLVDVRTRFSAKEIVKCLYYVLLSWNY